MLVDILKYKINVPSPKTQTQVVDKLLNNLEYIKKTQINIQNQIKTLTQYRQSLIHECVTGKKRIYQGDVN